MFLHYLGKVNSSNLLQITTEKIQKRVVFDKNETFMLSYSWLEIGVLFSTAYARSVRRSPARMHEDACATSQLHCQWCSGRRYATLAEHTVSVRQCRALATEISRPKWSFQKHSVCVVASKGMLSLYGRTREKERLQSATSAKTSTLWFVIAHAGNWW